MRETDKERDALWRRQGRMMAKGVVDELFILLTFFLLAVSINFLLFSPTDDCDASFWHRCGMRVLTDHKSGIQYLETRGGGIIERKPRATGAQP